MAETNLDEKRAQLDAQLAALKMSPAVADLVREADRAVSAYRADATALESQIAEIDAALGVREGDRRAAADQQRQQKWLAARQELLDGEERRLQAVERAEQATRALAKSIEEIEAANAHMSTLARALSPDRKVPMPLNPMELVNRMAARIAAVMATVNGHRARLGGIEWPAGASGLYPPDRSWRDDEEKRMAAGLQRLLEKGKA